MAIRQEVLNVLLAQLLIERGLPAESEQIVNFRQQSRQIPDVIVDFQGLRLAIEGEFASRSRRTLSSAENKAIQAALRRVEQGIAHISVALIYPSVLRSIPFSSLKGELARSSLRFAIITESYQQELSLFPGKEPVQFTEGNIDALAEAIRRAYEQLIRDEVLERAVALIEASMERFITALATQRAATERFKSVLEVKELPEEPEEKEEGKEDE
jgi:hypothetical protein